MAGQIIFKNDDLYHLCEFTSKPTHVGDGNYLYKMKLLDTSDEGEATVYAKENNIPIIDMKDIHKTD